MPVNHVLKVMKGQNEGIARGQGEDPTRGIKGQRFPAKGGSSLWVTRWVGSRRRAVILNRLVYKGCYIVLHSVT